LVGFISKNSKNNLRNIVENKTWIKNDW